MVSLLSIQDVTRVYRLHGKKIWALKEISLEISPNQTLGIAGESGSGKSTLARLLMGLEKPDQGKILYKGNDLAGMNKKTLRAFRRHLGVVFQQPQLSFDPRWTLERSIEEPLRFIAKTKKERRSLLVREAAAQVGLSEELLTMFPQQLSGGQLQRAAIARALIMKPELLILDEPTSALDISIQAQILNVLRELKNKLQMTFIVISHDLPALSYLADQMVIMRNGKVVESGTKDETLRRPQQEYTKMLLASAL